MNDAISCAQSTYILTGYKVRYVWLLNNLTWFYLCRTVQLSGMLTNNSSKFQIQNTLGIFSTEQDKPNGNPMRRLI